MTPMLGSESFPIDVPRLIETRAIVTANSGGGKSWALRRMLEQTYGQVQHLVVDVEDEFYTLREKFDYVLAGRQGGDCPADLRSAELLGRRLLELRASAVVGIYELKAAERIRFVRLFLESLINAPKSLWHPVLVVIDEAHIFAPESGKAESKQAVIDLMTRGRKRGMCGILATQRPAQLDKDASAQAINKLVGRASQDIDVKRAAEDLGFYRKEDQARLRALQPGSFYAVGPAFSDQVAEVRIGPVQTTHPRAGQQVLAPPPPREQVQKVLGQLADLPKQAEEEARTVEELNRRIRELERAARAPGITPAELTAARQEGERSVIGQLQRIEMQVKEQLSGVRGQLDLIDAAVQRARSLVTIEIYREKPTGTHAKPPATVPSRVESTPPRPRATPRNGATRLTGPEQRIVDAIAWLNSIGVDDPEQVAVAFLAGYTVGGGAFNNPRGALRMKGLVEYVSGDRIRLTSEGTGAANCPAAPLSSGDLQERILERLPGPESKILQVLIDAYPLQMTNDECARRAGYTPDGGAYNNPRGRLRTLGLIDYPERGKVVAKKLLFLE